MKKYFQIISVLGIFGLLVLVRQHVGGDVAPIVTKSQSATLPTSTATPTQSQASQQTDSQNQIPSQLSATPIPTTVGLYKNGTFTGGVADAFYGNIQVQAVIAGGKLSDVIFLQYPNDNRTSQYINSQAMTYLKEEAIAAQSANVNIVSGASASSQAFQQSLASALSQAK